MKKVLFTSLFAMLVLAMTSYILKPQGYEVGDLATDFSLKNTNGEMVSLADAKYADAKGFIVIFTCNHCPYAVAYEDRIMEIHEKYGKEFPVIAINPNVTTHSGDTYEDMQTRVSEKGFTFDYLADEDQSITKTYGAVKTPHVYLLEKENADLKVAYIGAIDNNVKDPSNVTEKYLENAIVAVQAGNEVSNTKTEAVGCSIKWAK